MVTSFVCENCNHMNIVRSNIKHTRKRRGERSLYEALFKMFNSLQEPINLMELCNKIDSKYPSLHPILEKHIKLGNVQHVEHSYNKYMLTMKGKHVLYLIQKLNEFMTTWESDIILPNLKAGRN